MPSHHKATALKVTATLHAFVLVVVGGCDKSQPSTESAPPSVAVSASAKEDDKTSAQAQVQIAAEHLAATYATDSPTSHANAPITVFANDQDQQQLHHLVVLGRNHASLNGKVVAKMRCLHKGAVCKPGQQRAAAALTSIDVQPNDLEAIEGEVLISGLRKAAVTLKATPVAIIADRRVQHTAVIAAIATLKQVGAHPIVAAVNSQGHAVLVARQDDSSDNNAKRAADVMGLPDQVKRVELHVSAGKLTTVLTPTGVKAVQVRNPLHGDRHTAVSRWADRMVEAYPKLKQISLLLKPGAPFADCVPLLDTLRDRCGPGSTGINCNNRTRRFSVVTLKTLNSEPPQAKVARPEIPMAPAGSISPDMLRAINIRRPGLMAPVPIAHELLQPNAIPSALFHRMPSRPVEARRQIGAPPPTP